MSHAREAGLDWIEDPSNARLNFDRNFLRRDIVPRLAGRWPNLAKTIAASAATQFARDALLDHLADSVSAAAPRSADSAAGAPVAGNRPGKGWKLALREFPAEHRAPVLRLWLRGLGEFSATERSLAEFARQFGAPPDAHPRLALRHGVLRRHGDMAVYTGPEFELRSSYRLDLPGVLALPHGNLTAEPHAAGFHATGTLEVRFRRGGERLRCGGRTRSVKKLLHAAQIPPWQRRTWPLIFSGGALLSVPGIATADSSGEDPQWRVGWAPYANP